MNTITSPPTELARFVARTVRMRELSAHLQQVVRLTNTKNLAVRDVEELLIRDDALARAVVRVADRLSSQPGDETSPVTDIPAAAERLGTADLLRLTASLGLVRESVNRAEARMRLRFWRATLVRSVAARQFAASVQPAAAVAALAAGMMRSVGMLVLSESLGQPYHDLLDEIESRRGDWLHLERVSLGFDHPTLTARLLEAWNFSPLIAAAVASGPAPKKNPATADNIPILLAHSLRAAHALSDLLVGQRLAMLPDFLLAAEDHFALTDEQLPEFIGEVEAGVQRLAAALEVPAAGYRGLCETWQRLRQKPVETQSEPPVEPLNAESLLAATHGLQNLANGALTPALVPTRSPAPGRYGFGRLPVEHSESLLSRLSAAVTTCRHARQALSLLVVEIDHFHELARVPEQSGLASIVDRVDAALWELVPESRHVAQTGESRFAIILEGEDRQHAVSTARSLLAELRHSPCDGTGRRSSPTTFSAGLATLAAPSKNFPPQDLLDAAHRCLQTARAAGGNTVKSIDIY